MYAGHRRRKPLPRATRPGAPDGGSSNPSRRHRLNRELERLAGLLPFPPDVLAGLDKLSVLRLSAAFLRARSFFSVALKNHSAKEVERAGDCGNGPAPGLAAVLEGELLLQALNDFMLVVTSEGLIFYSSHTIQDYLGFHQGGGSARVSGGCLGLLLGLVNLDSLLPDVVTGMSESSPSQGKLHVLEAHLVISSFTPRVQLWCRSLHIHPPAAIGREKFQWNLPTEHTEESLISFVLVKPHL